MFNDLVSVICFIVYTVLFYLFVFLYVQAVIKNRKLNNQVVVAAIEKSVLLTKLDELVTVDDANKVENTDGFLRFISDSREWAFKYIEDVQESLEAYDAALHTDDAKIINDAYAKLIDFLPKDDVVK